MDGEFTGILPFDKMNYFDTPAERYKRHYDVNFDDEYDSADFYLFIFSVIDII